MSLIIFTGANGFIGSRVLLHFYKNMNFLDVKFVAVDMINSFTREQHILWQSLPNVEFVRHDDLKGYLLAAEEPVLAVIHNGACSSTEETDPKIFQELNLSYSQMLWQYCLEKNVPFIYASSAGVYGDGLLGFSDKREDCSKYIPLSLYAKSKLDFDLWALAQSSKPPLWAGLRYFNVYGEGEHHKGRQASMVLHAHRQIINTQKIKLYKTTNPALAHGEQKRDFVYVGDICKLTENLLSNYKNGLRVKSNGLFLNVGTGVAQSWNTLMEAIFIALKMDKNIEYIDMPESLVKQYQNFTEADLTSWKEVGIVPSPIQVADGVLRYINWLQAGAGLNKIAIN